MSHAGIQLTLEFFWQYTTTARIFFGINRGTRPDPEKVNQPQVESLCFKRGPTPFCFMP